MSSRCPIVDQHQYALNMSPICPQYVLKMSILCLQDIQLSININMSSTRPLMARWFSQSILDRSPGFDSRWCPDKKKKIFNRAGPTKSFNLQLRERYQDCESDCLGPLNRYSAFGSSCGKCRDLNGHNRRDWLGKEFKGGEEAVFRVRSPWVLMASNMVTVDFPVRANTSCGYDERCSRKGI